MKSEPNLDVCKHTEGSQAARIDGFSFSVATFEHFALQRLKRCGHNTEKLHEMENENCKQIVLKDLKTARHGPTYHFISLMFMTFDINLNRKAVSLGNYWKLWSICLLRAYQLSTQRHCEHYSLSDM